MSKPQTLNMQIKSVLDVLRKELRPMTPEEIEKILGTDIVNNQELRKNVESSTKFLRERDGRWRWKSQYYIRNKDELLVFLRKRHDGVPRAALDDCYKGVTDDMKDIINSKPREVIVLKNSTDKKEIVYPYESALSLPVSDDIRGMWETIHAPDRIEVHRYLIENGVKKGKVEDFPQLAVRSCSLVLSSAPQNVKFTRQLWADNVSLCILSSQINRRRPRGQKARSNKRMKLTNVHLEGTGIDLQEDPTAKDGKGTTAFN
uniref:TFA2 Winged helix domain-containing protein n=1 Tax=Rhodosorus marinus TaxID=101924 RepID=A0A7S3EEF9_9RHOD|mmetsp:Transcript_29847/g.114588  ORF Transcript_29847/g.114588 Transcript_29847/m.114588 type:complete len:260 (+) Transcript_29847:477-1256(+)